MSALLMFVSSEPFSLGYRSEQSKIYSFIFAVAFLHCVNNSICDKMLDFLELNFQLPKIQWSSCTLTNHSFFLPVILPLFSLISLLKFHFADSESNFKS